MRQKLTLISHWSAALNGCHLRVCEGTWFPHAPHSGGVCGVVVVGGE
jgi:hypothetical protein